MDTVEIDKFPFGKQFAVTFIDDTDGATLKNIRPVYDFLSEKNMYITKTVWPLKATDYSGGYKNASLEGETLQDQDYKYYCKELQERGFELAMHTASAGNSLRSETVQAYDFFEETFGHSPHTNIMHSRNIENIYWGKYISDNPIISKLLSILEPLEFSGHAETSPYFWGDVCKQRTKYVRLFETMKLNTLLADPSVPFHDPSKPFVNWWFNSTYGAGICLINLLNDINIEKLRKNRGAGIIHMYCRHYSIKDGKHKFKLNPVFKNTVDNLMSYKMGWFVPVVELLDRFRGIRSLKISFHDKKIKIQNKFEDTLKNVALNVTQDIPIYQNGKQLPRKDNQILIGDIGQGETLYFTINTPVKILSNKQESYPYIKCRPMKEHAKRISWQILKGRRKRVPGKDPAWVEVLQDKNFIDES